MMARFASYLIPVILLFVTEASWAERAVVLVVSKASPIEQLSTLELRKAYLGIAVTIDGRSVNALHLKGDEQLHDIFLQSVVAMSSRTYERRLLASAMQTGRPRPREADSREQLINLMASNPFFVGYMWKSDADADERVKIIRVLWQGP